MKMRRLLFPLLLLLIFSSLLRKRVFTHNCEAEYVIFAISDGIFCYERLTLVMFSTFVSGKNILRGSHASWKVMEFKNGIFQAWKVVEFHQ